MRWVLFALAALQLAGTLHLVTQVGKPRQPMTPTAAAVGAAVGVGMVVILVVAGMMWP